MKSLFYLFFVYNYYGMYQSGDSTSMEAPDFTETGAGLLEIIIVVLK